MRTRRIVTLVVVPALCALLGACGSAAPRSSSPPPPPPTTTSSHPPSMNTTSSPAAKSLDPFVAAGLAQTSVHWTADDSGDMEGDAYWAADVNANSGKARVTWDVEGDDGAYTIVLVNDIVYFKGDSGDLQGLDLTAAQAKRYAGRWISIPKGDSFYAGLAEGLTLPSAVHEWASKADSASTSGEPLLPLGFSERVASDEVITGSFSRWNEPVHVEAPADSTPIATARSG